MTHDLREAKGTLVIMGRSVLSSGEYGVLGTESFPVEVLASKPFHFEAKQITSEFDDKGTGSKYGFRYSGYIFALEDSEGTIIRADASPEANAKLAQKALTLKALQYVDRSLEPLKGKPVTTIRLK